MNKSPKSAAAAADSHDPCQLYLAVRATSDATTLADKLAAIFGQVAIPSLLIEPRPGDSLSATLTLPLVEMAQANGVAVMISDDAGLARSVRADGVHLTSSPDMLDRLQAAREIAGKTLMIGADAGTSRHDAMVIGESGADYVAFGIAEGARERTDAIAQRYQMVEWWSKVFEVPCVALNLEPDETDCAADLAAVGADFACVRLPDGRSGAELVAWAGHLIHRLDEAGVSEKAA